MRSGTNDKRTGREHILSFTTGHLCLMPRYYFDFHDAGGVTKDETGEELPSESAARSKALVALGEIARDVTLYGQEGQIAIEVRNSKSEAVLVAYANIGVVSKNAQTDSDRT